MAASRVTSFSRISTYLPTRTSPTEEAQAAFAEDCLAAGVSLAAAPAAATAGA